MCSNQNPSNPKNMPTSQPILPFPLATMKPFDGPNPTPQFPPPSGLLPIDQYRLQLYNYAMVERLRFSNFGSYSPQIPFCPGYPYNPRLALQMSLFHNRVFQPEEPKPQHSYIGLIAMAILSSPEGKLVLSDIYQYILDNYPYFRSRGPGWRNSIRHNLSLNDCFIKAGRSANGKGHYWAVHPANIEDFKKGDFRRRKAQRKVRKHMGLAVDEEGDESPSPPPVPLSPPASQRVSLSGLCPWPTPGLSITNSTLFAPIPNMPRKRQFDVASLLAPDEDKEAKVTKRLEESYISSGEEPDPEEDIDVVTEDLSSRRDESNDPSEPGTSPRSSSPTFLQGPLQGNSPQASPSLSPHNMSEPPRTPKIPLWVKQPSIIHPTAIFPPATLSYVEHQQQMMSKLYEQRILVAQQKRYASQAEELSPVNLKNEVP